ncbi:MAG: hypothetical protein DRI77_11685 [Chloroflexi bacterium]|nr:MAG: hypothetical protein DRI77_11685 [Chloroflexota bacterium]
MNETDKLRVLLPHWIEHNGEHASEFKKWAEKAEPAVREAILAAASLMDEATVRLREAQNLIGK